MNYLEEISKIFHPEEAGGIINLECYDQISDQLLACIHKKYPDCGFVLRDDRLYETQTPAFYLKFFAKLCGNRHGEQDAIRYMHLQDFLHRPIGKLTEIQKRRLAIGREIAKGSQMIFLQEPLRNLDEDSIKIVLEWVETSLDKGKILITTSLSLKLAYYLPGGHYFMDENEIVCLDNQEDEEVIGGEQEMNGTFAVEKISARQEDKILLFNPNEIDYVESQEGKAYVWIRSSSFPTGATLDELEVRLKKYGFFRSHRSYLVNMQKVKEIIRWTKNSYSLKLDGREGSNIPLSKGRIEEMKELYRF